MTRDFKPVKPHPAPIQHICSHWDVPCENTLMVGDDIQDIKSGNAAGSGKVYQNYGQFSRGKVKKILVFNKNFPL